MRALVLGLLGACTSAHDANVRVEIPPTNGLGFASIDVMFEAANAGAVTPTVEAGWWIAPLPAGGNVSVSLKGGSSPSNIGHMNWSVAGVEPGDVFPVQPAAVPPDCTCRSVSLSPDGSGSSWTDPDAASVDARIITMHRQIVGPFTDPGFDTRVDNDTSTYVPYQANGTNGYDLTVHVVTCTTSTWDDIRTRLGTVQPAC